MDMRRRMLLAGVLGACTAWCAAPCGANGMFVNAAMEALGRSLPSGTSAAQCGIIIRDGGHEVLLLRTTYRGPSGDFAWVVPVPRAPDGDDGLFTASNEFIDQTLGFTRPDVRMAREELLRAWPMKKKEKKGSWERCRRIFVETVARFWRRCFLLFR